MTCREIETILPGYLDDALSADEHRAVAEHLATCQACRATLAELTRSVNLAKGLEDVQPPAWLKAKIMEQVRAEAASNRTHGLLRKFFFPLSIKIPLQAIATVVVAIFAFYLYKASAPELINPGMQKIPVQESVPAPTGGSATAGRQALREPPQATRYQAEVPRIVGKGSPNAGMEPAPALSKEKRAMSSSKDTTHAEEQALAPASAVPDEAMEKDVWQHKEEKVPADKLAKTRLPMLGMAAQEVAPLSAEAPTPPKTITLSVADPGQALKALEETAQDLHGRSTILEQTDTAVIVSVALPPDYIPKLLAKLAQLGTLKPSQSTPAPGTDIVIVRLEKRTPR